MSTLRSITSVPDAASQTEISPFQCDFQPQLPAIWGTASISNTPSGSFWKTPTALHPPTARSMGAPGSKLITSVAEISDTGAGIAPDHLPHIFKTFWRQDDAHSTPGFGLGLPITHTRLCSCTMAEIEVESIIGQGTTFAIVLPSLH